MNFLLKDALPSTDSTNTIQKCMRGTANSRTTATLALCGRQPRYRSLSIIWALDYLGTPRHPYRTSQTRLFGQAFGREAGGNQNFGQFSDMKQFFSKMSLDFVPLDYLGTRLFGQVLSLKVPSRLFGQPK